MTYEDIFKEFTDKTKDILWKNYIEYKDKKINQICANYHLKNLCQLAKDLDGSKSNCVSYM